MGRWDETMPFGYRNYLKRNGKSDRTIEDYISVVSQFFYYLDKNTKEQLEVFEIQGRHIRAFLEKKRKQDKNEINTINKNITILKNFFNYLWESNQIPIDPAGKIKHLKVQTNKRLALKYEMLQEILPDIINNKLYSDLRKIIFILAMYGFRVQDYHILKKEVIDKGESVMIFPKIHEPVELYGKEAEIFLSVYYQSLFTSSKYVFTTKRHKDDSLVPIEVMGVYKHLSEIAKDYNLPTKLNTNVIRHAYAYYLYHNKNLTFERIATILGIEDYSAALLVRESERRIKNANETLEIS